MPDIKTTLFALIRNALPLVDHYALYHGKVVKWTVVIEPDGSAVQTVDVQPNDARLPSMGSVPFRHGLPGVVANVGTGTSVLVGWENGDASLPYACLWSGNEGGVSLTINADSIILGGTAGAEPAAKGQTLQTYLDALGKALTSHIHVCTGGTVSPSVLLPETVTAPPDLLATNVQVK